MTARLATLRALALAGVLAGLLVGVLLVGPAHELVHLVDGHGCHAHVGAVASGGDLHGHDGAELSIDAGVDAAHGGHCVFCGVTLEDAPDGAPWRVVVAAAAGAPPAPRECPALLDDGRSHAPRGPPTRT